jgi:hypothetical protein
MAMVYDLRLGTTSSLVLLNKSEAKKLLCSEE